MTFIGAKGGAGTTTVSLNVAAAIASPEHNTIAAEWCWPRGNFSLYVSEQPAVSLSAIGTLPPRAITRSVLKNLLTATSPHLMLLHGPQTAADFHYLNPAQAGAFVSSLLQLGDIAVMDLPPQPSAVCRVAVQNSSVVVVVAERDPVSIALANETLFMVRSWAGPATAVSAVLVNKGLASALTLDDIRSRLQCDLIGVVPPSSEPVPGFFNRIPITLSKKGTLASEALTDIANRLASKQLEFMPA